MPDWTRLMAKDVMSAPALTVTPDLPIQDLVSTLSERGYSGAPVVGSGGRLVGVISLFDVVTFLSGVDRPVQRPGGFHGPAYPDLSGGDGAARWERGVGRREEDLLAETTVSDLMSGDVLQVAPETPLPDVAALLVGKRIHRVVVTAVGAPLGVVSTLDVLAALRRGASSGVAPKPAPKRRAAPAKRR